MEAEPVVSVIVPFRNAVGELEPFVAAIDRQTEPPGAFELLLVDDASEDGSASAARQLGARVLELERHAGPYVARNAGAALARGRVLAFTDVDCEPAADWVERGLAAFADARVDLVAGHIEVPLGDRPSLATLLDVANFVDQERCVEKGFALGGNLWVRRSVFEGIGRFNEQLLSGGDQEFTRRAVAAGTPIVYAADVRVSHPPYTRGRELARKARRIGFGAAQHRSHATGPLRERSLLCNRPRHYIPRRKLHGLDRLERAGYRPRALRRAALLVWSYAFLQLPMVAGNLEGTLRRR